ncbi:MAG: tryptophan 7-halogenase [Ardenticatenaceae bacterium]|nr:tryptophan 7-halogenase [Anaerolineales bacterium]MCB8978411.1 tryptophan 7-halogenase [Ardenticatenaceae bacterium]
MNSTFKTDVAIIGGGPGGAASAIFLAEKGLKSIIIEKEAFPRFHIGESMTGECGNLVRRLGLSEAMDQVPRTIKPGVIVYGKSGKNTFHIPVMRRNEAGELEQSFTWQVRRGEFDKMLLDKAQENGASILRGKAVKVLTDETGTPCGVQVRQEDGQLTDVLAEVLIDASGPATFLHTEGFTSERERGKYDRQIAIYTHVKGATRDEEDHTRIFYEMRNHWAWFIPIDEETVSIGVVTPSDYYRDSKEDLREFFLREIHKINPQLSLRVPDVSLVEEVRATSNYSYHIRNFTGKGFLCVGDSHRFIDPIFSFGLHFALTEGKMAADAIANYLLNGVGRDVENPFAEYERYCELGMDTIQDVLDCFWDQPTPFAFMVHSRYVDDFIDLFAGRVYQEDPSPGLQAIRKVNAKLREKLQPQH